MNERLRKLRDELKLSRSAFGQRIGVSGDVVNNLERGRVEIKEHIIKLVCAEFSVNEEWFKYGTGEMFTNNEAQYNSLIDRIMVGENDFAKNVFKTFSLLDENDWKTLQQMIDKYLSISKAAADSETTESIVTEAEAEYIKSRSNSVQKTNLSALNMKKDTENQSSDTKKTNDTNAG